MSEFEQEPTAEKQDLGDQTSELKDHQQNNRVQMKRSSGKTASTTFSHQILQKQRFEDNKTSRFSENLKGKI